MKKLLFAAIALALLAPGCKTSEKMKKKNASETTEVVPAAQQSSAKVFTAPAQAAPTAPEYTAPAASEAPAISGKPVRTQAENFSFAHQEDMAQNGNNSFFVIVGSFSSIDNANRFKQELIPQGFSPIVLKSENGYFRVCVNSYSVENEARARVQSIRTNFPKYADAWLLIRK